MKINHTGYCMSHRGQACTCGAADSIYDESGLIIGEASPIGEQRLETETTDIELPSILDDDVLTESGLFPKHNPFTYRVEESRNIIDRNDFVLRYLAAKESCPALLQ